MLLLLDQDWRVLAPDAPHGARRAAGGPLLWDMVPALAEEPHVSDLRGAMERGARLAGALTDGAAFDFIPSARGASLVLERPGAKADPVLLDRLEEAELRFRWITESIDDAFYLIDPDTGQMSYVSRGYEKVWGRSRSSLYEHAGSALDAVLPEDRALVAAQIPIQESRSHFDIEYRIRRPDGAVRWIHDRGFVVRDDDGHIRHYVGVATDVTERKNLVENLAKKQRLEAVGRFTAQLAHDFNNLITAATLLTSNAKRGLAPGQEMPQLDQLSALFTRGSSIINSLLLASGHTAPTARVYGVDRLVEEMQPLLAAAAGDAMTLTLALDAAGAEAELDRETFASSLTNLCANSREADPNGRFLVRTSVVELPQAASGAASAELPPGRYVLVEAIDHGPGMPQDVSRHAFDPFFSTKPSGFGSGLSLASVYGFSRSSGGSAEIDSEPGRGTTVRIYLPVWSDQTGAPAAPEPAAPTAARILLVDDEPLFLEGVCGFLAHHGYEVATAASGAEALERVDAERFDAVITDSKMPGMSGLELATHLADLRPDLPVMIISGFTGDMGAAKGRWPVLAKSALVGNICGMIEDMLAKPPTAA